MNYRNIVPNPESITAASLWEQEELQRYKNCCTHAFLWQTIASVSCVIPLFFFLLIDYSMHVFNMWTGECKTYLKLSWCFNLLSNNFLARLTICSHWQLAVAIIPECSPPPRPAPFRTVVSICHSFLTHPSPAGMVVIVHLLTLCRIGLSIVWGLSVKFVCVNKIS